MSETHKINVDGILSSGTLPLVLATIRPMAHYSVHWCPENVADERVTGDAVSVFGPWARINLLGKTQQSPENCNRHILFKVGDVLEFSGVCRYKIRQGEDGLYLIFLCAITPEPILPDYLGRTGLFAKCIMRAGDIVDKTVSGVSKEGHHLLLRFSDDTFAIYEFSDTSKLSTYYEDEGVLGNLIMVEPFKHRFLLKAAGILTPEAMRELCEAESKRQADENSQRELREVARLKKKYGLILTVKTLKADLMNWAKDADGRYTKICVKDGERYKHYWVHEDGKVRVTSWPINVDNPTNIEGEPGQKLKYKTLNIEYLPIPMGLDIAKINSEASHAKR
jgi:hypothetical protein